MWPIRIKAVIGSYLHHSMWLLIWLDRLMPHLTSVGEYQAEEVEELGVEECEVMAVQSEKEEYIQKMTRHLLCLEPPD